MQSLSCPNRHCPPSGKGNVGAIIRHGFYTTSGGSVVALFETARPVSSPIRGVRLTA
jgi:hypothetical protein